LQTRAASSEYGLSSASWSEAYTYSGGSRISAPANQWIQFRANLYTADSFQTPVLHEVTLSGRGGDINVRWSQAGSADWNAGTHDRTRTEGEDMSLESTSQTRKAYDDHTVAGRSGGLFYDSGSAESNALTPWAGHEPRFGGSGRIYINIEITDIIHINSAMLHVTQTWLQGDPSPIYVDHVNYGDTFEFIDWDCEVYSSDFYTFNHSGPQNLSVVRYEIDVTNQLEADISAGRVRSQYRFRSDKESSSDLQTWRCDTRACQTDGDSFFPPDSGPYIEYTYDGYYTLGEFISRPYNAGKNVPWIWMSWGETLPGGSRITLQTRTAPTEPELGSAGWSEEYTYSGGSLISSPENSWVQFKANLYTDDPLQTPLLHGVTCESEGPCTQGATRPCGDCGTQTCLSDGSWGPCEEPENCGEPEIEDAAVEEDVTADAAGEGSNGYASLSGGCACTII
jgi:hypothetical protein